MKWWLEKEMNTANFSVSKLIHQIGVIYTAFFQSEKVKKVEFESDEPLADYVVMKDIKDVVDQIAHIPLAERKRLFETRVVYVDDIADFVAIQDNKDAGVFAANLRTFEESVHSVQQDTDKIDWNWPESVLDIENSVLWLNCTLFATLIRLIRIVWIC